MTKEELIDKYRDINLNWGEWWESVYAEFEKDMEAEGIEVTKIQFEGFYHQGSHAVFEATIPPRNMTKFMEKHNMNMEYLAMYALAEQKGLWVTKNFFGRVSSSIDIHSDEFSEIDMCDDEDMDAYYTEIYSEQFEQTLSSFEEQIVSILEGYDRELYKRLQDTYEHLTSDEVVWEAIEANGMDDEIDEIQTAVCKTEMVHEKV